MAIEYRHLKQRNLFYSNPTAMRWRVGHDLITGWSEWFSGVDHEPDWYPLNRYEVELASTLVCYQSRIRVPTPEMVAPSAGTKYYSYSVGVRRYVWSDCRYDRRLLHEGLVYLTEVKAAERYQAWLKLEEE